MENVPTVRLDPNTAVPALRQIVDNLRILLVGGELAPGASLPSVRRLAMELGVHFNTVAEAYRQLAAEGWLELKHGRAALVNKRTQSAQPDPARVEALKSRLRALVAEMRAEGMPPAEVAAELRSLSEEMNPCSSSH